LSSDDVLLMSGSNTQIKIWNLQSKQCIKTMASGYALCGIFVPGNKHVCDMID
jgi:U3 small nucleolar RNA-associated protein 12